MAKKNNNKTTDIRARVTEKEKERIQKIAAQKGMSVSSLILNSIENNITVNLDTSDYRDLVIQVRRIGNNINNVIRDIRFKNYYTDKDMLDIKNSLNILNETIIEERKEIKKTVTEFENLTTRQLKNLLEKEGLKTPKYLIYEGLEEHIIFELRSFIDLINKSKIDNSYSTYIEYFIKDFQPREYEYNNLVDFSDELDDIIYKINLNISSGSKELTEEDFLNLMEVIDKYRKVVDE